MINYNENISLNIVKFREKNKISQEKMAADLGMSVSHLRSIEQAIANPTVKTLIKISEYMNTTVNKLLEDNKEEK